VRGHDVAPHVEALRVLDAVMRPEGARGTIHG
jgi:dihydropteroate synthase